MDKLNKRCALICKKLGVKYLGILPVPDKYKGKYDTLIGFHDEVTGDTMYIKQENFTHEKVRDLIADIRFKFREGEEK